MTAGRAGIGCSLAVAVACLSAPPSGAASDALDHFTTCIATEVSYFERDYKPMSGGAAEAAGFEHGNFDWVDYCGMQGIVWCDASEDRFGCQRALRETTDTLKDKVLESLPDPADVAGRAGHWSDRLYPMAWALAHGRSAGPDCGGAEEAMEVWCEAREANGRLRLAILAWQVARFLDAADPAVIAGWAAPPPPVRPRHRPDDATR